MMDLKKFNLREKYPLHEGITTGLFPASRCARPMNLDCSWPAQLLPWGIHVEFAVSRFLLWKRWLAKTIITRLLIPSISKPSQRPELSPTGSRETLIGHVPLVIQLPTCTEAFPEHLIQFREDMDSSREGGLLAQTCVVYI